MNRLSRTFAVVATATVVLSPTVPAVAAEGPAVATDVTAKAYPNRHRRRDHIRHVAAVTPVQRDVGCSGEWCGRQFVLIIGIGF
jgi:hypothetical protein